MSEISIIKFPYMKKDHQHHLYNQWFFCSIEMHSGIQDKKQLNVSIYNICFT